MINFEEDYPLFVKKANDSYVVGEFELRKLNTGNWVFRHNIKENCYINLGKTLSTAKMWICLAIIEDLTF